MCYDTLFFLAFGFVIVPDFKSVILRTSGEYRFSDGCWNLIDFFSVETCREEWLDRRNFCIKLISVEQVIVDSSALIPRYNWNKAVVRRWAQVKYFVIFNTLEFHFKTHGVYNRKVLFQFIKTNSTSISTQNKTAASTRNAVELQTWVRSHLIKIFIFIVCVEHIEIFLSFFLWNLF